MEIIVIEPDTKITVKNIDGLLEEMQDIVGGYLQPVNIHSSTHMMLVDEDAKMKVPVPLVNTIASRIAAGNMIVGTAIIVRKKDME